MNFIKSFFEENRKLFFSVALVWICACVTGSLYGSKIDGESFLILSKSISSSFNPAPGIGEMIGKGFILKTGLFLGVMIASTGPLLSPIIYLISAFDGFSLGISCALIIRMYSLKGSLINLIIYIFPLSLSLPLCFMLFVSGLKFSLAPRENILNERVSVRRKQWFSYFLLQGTISLCLFLIKIAEAFLCREIITFIT